MNRKALLFGAVAVVLVGGLAAAGLWNWVLGTTLAPSGAITAVPLAITESTATPAATTGARLVTAESVAAVDAAVVSSTATPEAAAASPAADASLSVVQISQDASQVRFVLSEVLRGVPTTVIGTSNQVAGEIAFDPNDLSASQVGVIQVDARSLATDDDKRNQAIRNRILNTDSYEFITFTPTQITGLAGNAQPGQTLTFQIAGDLTIRDMTQPVIFDVTATADDAGQLSGTAETTIQRSDFGLTIPSVPFVADVSEDVQLQIDFVAAA
jgi:polyisoprenoid-binding protein YceI